MMTAWKRLFLFTMLFSALLLGCGSAPEPADLVLTHGKVVTVDASQPEVEAVAIVGNRIVAVGSSDEIASYIGTSTRIIDLEGNLAVPGFIEGHGHFMSLGRSKRCRGDQRYGCTGRRCRSHPLLPCFRDAADGEW
jgi:hypothetical protein